MLRLSKAKNVAKGRIEKTQPFIFLADETADVGLDNQTPVAEGIDTSGVRKLTSPVNSYNHPCGERCEG